MDESPSIWPMFRADERQGTHWQGCWRAHHACAVHLLERILTSSQWAQECEELGCTDPEHYPEHSSRSVAPPGGLHA